MGILFFDKRISYKPSISEVLQFVDAINKSFWVHSEIDFTADVQDFHSIFSHCTKKCGKTCALAIVKLKFL